MEPKYKQTNDKPSNKKHDIKPPKTKYFNPASVENSELRLNVAKIYKVRLCNSIAKYISKNSLQKHKQIALIITKINKRSYSNFIIFLAYKKSREQAKAQTTKKTNNNWKF